MILKTVSQEDIERLRRGYEAFERGEVESFLDFIDPDFEVHSGADVPDTQVYRGREGFLANVREWSEVFEDLHFDPEEFIDGGNRLVVLVHVSGRGRGSGAEFDQHQAHLWTVRDGKAVRLEFHADRAGAERAAGLRG